jgi:cell division transport system permease protein
VSSTRFRWFFGEALRSLRTNFATTLAAVVTVLIVLYIVGVGLGLGTYLTSYTDSVKRDLTIKVWLDDAATEQQVGAIQKRLLADPRIDQTSFLYVSKDAALREAQKLYSPEALHLIAGNPFPARFQVKGRDARDSATIAAAVTGLPGLARATKDLPNPDYGAKTADRVLSVARAIEVVIAGLAVILAVAAVLLIGNTIRLSIFARRREVEVMKLVGATNWFVRWPFMLEGMIAGSVGALLASAGLVVSSTFMPRVFNSASAIKSSTAGGAHAWPLWQIAAVLVIAGLGLGAAGSGLTMRRFLRI